MHFLPITFDEVKRLGWEYVDIIIVSGDAYIDHPSFGTAVVGRMLEKSGFRVAILPQPNWRDDWRDFKKFGRPRLFFGVTSGVMDSMVNHYTAARRLRHDDAYTPGGSFGFRPDYATYCYSKILKQLYPDVPVVIGGIEASMRRLAHYDYWSDSLKPSILCDCGADWLVYGMAEHVLVDFARAIDQGASAADLRMIPQLGYVTDEKPIVGSNVIELHSFESCLASKFKQAENFHVIEIETNKIQQRHIVQKTHNKYVVINPPQQPLTTEQLDASFDLPYCRKPHPKYKKRGDIPAFEMIRNSINIHRGCFGGCSFCTISAHQGKQIVSRSESSILREVEILTQQEGFHGVISDLGGPSANMYMMSGKNKSICEKCARYSCIHPSMCPNLESSHKRLSDLYAKVMKVSGVKHLYIGSGIRCDLFNKDNGGWEYFKNIVLNHVGGRLKVAPEHTEQHVLDAMRKPSHKMFLKTKSEFEGICKKYNLRYQLIPYFISSHPGCEVKDMAALAMEMKRLGYKLEQVQDFTPTPMTLSTEMYYTGYNPATMKPIYVARKLEEKKDQRSLFFYYKKECAQDIRRILTRSNNAHWIKFLLK